MDLKSMLTKQGLRLMQDPRVARLMQDERVMKTLVQAMQARGKLQQELDDRVERVARALNLATKRELRELKRSLRRMEQELEKAKSARTD
jgi:HAMP domain-containing protein